MNAPNTFTTYPWQESVLDALTERQHEYLSEKISTAERAISQRLRERPQDMEEQLALKDALHALQVLFLQSNFNEQVTDGETIA
jgi:hypothetical protein